MHIGFWKCIYNDGSMWIIAVKDNADRSGLGSSKDRPCDDGQVCRTQQIYEKDKAIIRIARKILNRIRYILKNHQGYEIGVVA